jgi:hypothetical protein
MLNFWLKIFSVTFIVLELIFMDNDPIDMSIKRYGYFSPLIYALTTAD